MENISKMTIDDSSSSMYFSFNSTTAYKMQMESAIDNSMHTEDEEECDQNNTLEADEANQSVEQIQTIKKLSFGASPAKAIPTNIMKAYKALSSTPTKAQLLRSVEVNRGSAAVDVDVDLGLAFLEAPQEHIHVLSEDKENQPQESQDIIYSETSSEIVVSVIEKTQEEGKPVKRVGFSNLPVLKSLGSSNIRGGTPKVRRSIPRHEPDLVSNRPSRIISKRISSVKSTRNYSTYTSDTDEIPKMLNSILKISKGLPPKRKSISNMDNPFTLLGKATRMSIVKTTLNSPARKVSRKSFTSVQVGKITTRLSNLPVKKGRSSIASTAASVSTHLHKNDPASTITSPKKRIVSLNSRKSLALPTSSIWVQNPGKTMPLKTSASNLTKNKGALLKSSNSIKEDFVCEVCSRKFLVFSIFEAHKRTHNKGSSSSSLTKQTISLGVDNKCRYCDKKFAIPKALENHLIQNCTKIPPGDKKKLLFPTDQSKVGYSRTKLPPKTQSNQSSRDSLTQHSRNQTNAKNPTNGNSTMVLPLSNNKMKKKLAHSGVYCTPNKQIICHICKTSFNNILAFTEHKLSHSAAPECESTCVKDSELIESEVGVQSDETRDQQNFNEGSVA